MSEAQLLPADKFADPHLTADGKARATVDLSALKTLWINTGTLCNLTCQNCYIESSPRNDALVYISAHELSDYLNEIERDNLPTTEIGFTGGEPFMNPHLLTMLDDVMGRGLSALVLTNAMKPMRKVGDGLIALNRKYPEQLTLRVSLDHYTKAGHETERGARSWQPALEGLRWLGENNFKINVAGRTFIEEEEESARRNYAKLFSDLGVTINASNAADLVLFPEMDGKADVPEITTECWGILDVEPESVMCASSRMVIKRKGSDKPAVVACTLLPYDSEFEFGETLAEASGNVALNHPHCAKFCVLGGASCSQS